MKKSAFHKLTAVTMFAFFCATAHAGVGTSLMQTANVKAPGEFEIKAQADIILDSQVRQDGGSGFNLSPHLETGIIEHYVDIDAFFGTGTTKFQIGALGKFNLLPDLPGQVGLSFVGGLSFIRDRVQNVTLTGSLVTTGLLISKDMEPDFGKVTPYLAYELEFLFDSEGNYLPNTLIGGAKWEPKATKNWAFYSEFSISVHQSFYEIAVGASQTF